MPTTSDSCNLSAPSSTVTRSLGKWVYDSQAPFRDGHYTVSYPQHTEQLWVWVLIIMCKK